MPPLQKFLIVDDNPDSRFVFVRTIMKQFPDAVLQECEDAEPALTSGREPGLSAVVVHRTTEMTGVYFVQSLRQLNSRVPIVMVSGIDRSHAAVAAGANRFLLFDNWKKLGPIISELLQPPLTATPTTPV